VELDWIWDASGFLESGVRSIEDAAAVHWLSGVGFGFGVHILAAANGAANKFDYGNAGKVSVFEWTIVAGERDSVIAGANTVEGACVAVALVNFYGDISHGGRTSL
jgi:hypothetical protein